jgi:hypothetical protein
MGGVFMREIHRFGYVAKRDRLVLGGETLFGGERLPYSSIASSPGNCVEL